VTHRPAPEAGRGPRLVLDDREWLLREGENVLGREDGVTVRITVGGVSRRHARIVVRADQTTVEDLGSKNGTFCGDDRISSPRALKDGDLIRLGRRMRLVFREMGDEGTETELPTAPDPAGAVFRCDGDYWTAVFEGMTVRLREVQGFPDIARLLARPGAEVHCLELAGRPGEGGGSDPVLDHRARREIQSRARELRLEIDEAATSNDLGRAERAREELDRITEVLSAALGLRGRSRDLGGAAERARSAVTWRIRSAIKKIESVHPRLGRHLANTVRTGTFCSYRPEAVIHWAL
jgi:pSer/pThr/pTyr-binding forkhead associated (FHA) protein